MGGMTIPDLRRGLCRNVSGLFAPDLLARLAIWARISLKTEVRAGRGILAARRRPAG